MAAAKPRRNYAILRTEQVGKKENDSQHEYDRRARGNVDPIGKQEPQNGTDRAEDAAAPGHRIIRIAEEIQNGGGENQESKG